jgi:hypothetical protein
MENEFAFMEEQQVIEEASPLAHLSTSRSNNILKIFQIEYVFRSVHKWFH